ncbi:MAG TPA: hypothetical protein PKD54_11020, partial [Pirellulaceae bacterium]|nr:hypothetical protein [Pirellulaceae bacterium]
MHSSSYDHRMVREARLALTVVAALLVAAALLGYRYMRSLSPDHGIPAHVLSAPPAEEVDASFIAEATVRRMRTKADPSRAAREYHSQHLPEDDPLRVAARDPRHDLIRNTVPAESTAHVLESGEANRNSVEQGTPQFPTRPYSTPPFATSADTLDDRPASELEFQPRSFQQQPLVPPRPLPPPPTDTTSTSWPSLETTPITAAPQPETEFHSAQVRAAWMPDSLSALNSHSFVGEERPVGPPEFEIRKVRTDQSLWLIAEELYGDGRWFRALYQHNIALYESATDGQYVDLVCPPWETLAASFPLLVPDRPAETRAVAARSPTAAPPSETGFWYVTAESDTLFGIARQELGQAGRYVEILDLNRERLPHDMHH